MFAWQTLLVVAEQCLPQSASTKQDTPLIEHVPPQSKAVEHVLAVWTEQCPTQYWSLAQVSPPGQSAVLWHTVDHVLEQ